MVIELTEDEASTIISGLQDALDLIGQKIEEYKPGSPHRRACEGYQRDLADLVLKFNYEDRKQHGSNQAER